MAGSKDPANENEPGREISPREIAVLIRCMAGNFPEIDAPYRMALLRKLVKAERRAGFVSAVEVVPAEALREAKAAHEKADAENRMLRAFIDRGEYQEDVAALLTVNRCSYCGDLVGSDPTLCGPCGGEADMERDEALEAAREAKAEVARLREVLDRFGGHRDDCNVIAGAPDCNCGFDEAYVRVRQAARGLESESKTGGHE